MPITIDRSISESGAEVPFCSPNFDTVSQMIKRLPPRGVGAVWGRFIHEEAIAYSRETGTSYAAAGRVIVSGTSFSVRRHAALKSGLYARIRYKVESFLIYGVPRKPTIGRGQASRIEFADIFDFAAAATWQNLVEFIESRYIETRRVKEGVEDDVKFYLTPFRNYRLSGDIVVYWRSGNPTYEDLIVLWMFYHGDRSGKFVILCDSKPQWIDSPSIIYSTEREYISVTDLLNETAKHLQKPIVGVKEAFSLWQRGGDSSLRNLMKRELITETHADQFLLAYSSIISETDDVGISIIVPKQQPAPLRFSSTEDRIDIKDERELQSSDPRIVGGASACISAVEDLRTYGGFSNVVPGFDLRCLRLLGLLKNLQTGTYDDNLVVQLGVEAQRFELRLSAAGEMVSEDAMAEVAACLPLLQGLLSQFSVWGSYKAKTLESPSNDESPQAAVDVLTSVRIRNDVLTGRAKSRVEDYVAGVSVDSPESDISPRIVVENMAAQAATFIAENAKGRKERVSKELVDEMLEGETPGPARWLIESAEDLETFAKVGKVSWLSTFLAALKTKRK